jgi:RNA exonuclease 1
MFTSKGLFSEITCPYKDDCVLPRCLFAHPKEAELVSPAPAALQPYMQNPSINAGSEISEAGPNKRRKIDENVSPRAHTDETKHEQKAVRKEPIQSTLRPISPPPTRRSTEIVSQSVLKTPLVGTKSPGELKAAATASMPAVRKAKNCETVAKTGVSVKAEKPLKTGSLNPRLLKSSPATHDMRYRLVKALHEQLLRLNSELAKDTNSHEDKLVLSDQHLITMALDIEERAAVDKPTIHGNIVKNTILKYKRMTVTDWKAERKAQRDVLCAKSSTSNSSTTTAAKPPIPKPLSTGLPPTLELALLPRLYTPLTALSSHGYVISVPSESDIEKARLGLSAAQGWEVCDRCKSRFQVFPGRRESDGLLTSGGSCTHHWGKSFFPERSADQPKVKREKRYACCGQAIGDSPGCTTSETHVFKVTEVKRLAAVENFIETPKNEKVDDLSPVCIDGEMGYTVHGLELIRLTATSWPSGTPILDVLVRPLGEVLDLNTRWSGVHPEQLANAKPLDLPTCSASSLLPTQDGKLPIVSSPSAARSLLCKFIAPETPIIGHGLENDLNAARLVHPTVVDTALLFPHRAGLPFRNALRTLVSLHLGRTIQSGGGMLTSTTTRASLGSSDGNGVGMGTTEGIEITAGHDSKEDANAAGDLVLFAVKREWEKMQAQGWKLEGEGETAKFVPPGNLTVEVLERGHEISKSEKPLSLDDLAKGVGTEIAQWENVRLEDAYNVVVGVKRRRANGEEAEEGEVDAV